MSYPTDVEIEDEYAELQLRAGRLIERDSEVTEALATPMNMTVRNGDVIVYHTAEHDARIVPVGDALRAALKKRLPDGSRAFSARPTGEAIKGQVKCYLHPEHPDRQKWYDMGITIMCQSGHFASIVDMERQMETKHGREWARMKALNERNEREEDRAFQRMMLERMSGGVATAPVEQVTTAPVATATWEDPVVNAEVGAFICEKCGKTFPTENGRNFHFNRWCRQAEEQA